MISFSNKQIINFFVLTCVFFVLINYFLYLIKANWQENSITNESQFKRKDIDIIWNVWVAITTNIWTRYKELSETPVNIYKDTVLIWSIIWKDEKTKNKFISTHMQLIQEYFNILKTDIKQMLSKSNDRGFALESYISQLEYRYKNRIENINDLIDKKNELLSIYNKTQTELNSLKQKIWNDFSNFDYNSTNENIKNYLKLKEENTFAYTYIVFINKFIQNYTSLNNYNKVLLDTLINNKEIIIKNTYVVIPDSWNQLLKELNLIYNEAEIKK